MENKETIVGLKLENDVLKKELEKYRQERDVLLCEVNRLKFELQIVDLKRIHEEEKLEIR